MSAWLQHAASTIARALSGVPGWVTALLIFGALVLFLRAALRRAADGPSDDACLQIPPPDVPLNPTEQPTEQPTDHEELTTR